MGRIRISAAFVVVVTIQGFVQVPLTPAVAQSQTSWGRYHSPVISSDGTHIAFVEEQIPSGREDIFVRNLVTGALLPVSAPTPGEANGDSLEPAISADGRYIAFESAASNLVPGDTNDRIDVFVRDTRSATTTRVSVSSSGEQSLQESFAPSISGDGRFVTFHTRWSLAPNDANYWVAGDPTDVYVRDTLLSTTTVASTNSSGMAAGWSSYPDISTDGGFICFESKSVDLVSGDSNGGSDVFVKNLRTGT